jgi:magnesium chelatase subunit H
LNALILFLTLGESVAIVLALVGAVPVKEGTGRVVRYDLVPLEELGRPRIDILASMSGIFRYVKKRATSFLK